MLRDVVYDKLEALRRGRGFECKLKHMCVFTYLGVLST